MIAAALALMAPAASGWEARYAATIDGESVGVVTLKVLRSADRLTTIETLTQRSGNQATWTVETREHTLAGEPLRMSLRRRSGDKLSEIKVEFTGGKAVVSLPIPGFGVQETETAPPAGLGTADLAVQLLGRPLPQRIAPATFARFNMDELDFERVALAGFDVEQVRAAEGMASGRKVALGSTESWWLDDQGMPVAIHREVEGEIVMLRRSGAPRAKEVGQ